MAHHVLVAAPLPPPLLAMLTGCDSTCLSPQDTNPGQLATALADAEGLLLGAHLSISADVLAAAPKLRVISNIGVGIDHIDVSAATERGVLVAHTPGVLTDAVAELVFGLMLMLTRRLPEASAAAREARWSEAPLGTDLRGKTILIVGFGRIGQAVAHRAVAFGMHVVFYDIRDDIATQPGAERVGLNEGLMQADIVTVHVDLSPGSKQLIGSKQIELMKPSAILVNTARGSVIDQAALHDAVADKRLAGAALDVTDPEPPDPSDPILQLPNVVVVPHIGSATRETRRAMVDLAIANLLACLNGEPCDSLANPIRSCSPEDGDGRG